MYLLDVPRLIDHDARRREIAELAARLVAEQGAENVSLRVLAAAAGASTTTITHYFANKLQVLESAYHVAVEHVRHRVEAITTDDADERLRQICEAVLPLDDPRCQDWRTFLAFLGTAIAEPTLRELQQRRVRGHRALLEETVAAGIAAGTIDPSRDPAFEARALLALIQGVATQAAFDREDWPPSRQLAILDQQLPLLRGPALEGQR